MQGEHRLYLCWDQRNYEQYIMVYSLKPRLKGRAFYSILNISIDTSGFSSYFTLKIVSERMLERDEDDVWMIFTMQRRTAISACLKPPQGSASNGSLQGPGALCSPSPCILFLRIGASPSGGYLPGDARTNDKKIRKATLPCCDMLLRR